MDQSVVNYFAEVKSDLERRSIIIVDESIEMVAEDGSRGMLTITAEIGTSGAKMVLCERVKVVDGKHIHRSSYRYYLAQAGEIYGEEFHPSHDPSVHRHIGRDHVGGGEASAKISHNEFCDRCWAIVSDPDQDVRKHIPSAAQIEASGI